MCTRDLSMPFSELQELELRAALRRRREKTRFVAWIAQRRLALEQSITEATTSNATRENTHSSGANEQSDDEHIPDAVDGNSDDSNEEIDIETRAAEDNDDVEETREHDNTTTNARVDNNGEENSASHYESDSDEYQTDFYDSELEDNNEIEYTSLEAHSGTGDESNNDLHSIDSDDEDAEQMMHDDAHEHHDAAAPALDDSDDENIQSSPNDRAQEDDGNADEAMPEAHSNSSSATDSSSDDERMSVGETNSEHSVFPSEELNHIIELISAHVGSTGNATSDEDSNNNEHNDDSTSDDELGMSSDDSEWSEYESGSEDEELRTLRHAQTMQRLPKIVCTEAAMAEHRVRLHAISSSSAHTNYRNVLSAWRSSL